jgi:hypothetical protein
MFQLNLDIIEKAFDLWPIKYKKKMTDVMIKNVEILKKEGFRQKST